MVLETELGKSPETEASHPHFFWVEFHGAQFRWDTLHHLRIVRLHFIRRRLDAGQVLEAKC